MLVNEILNTEIAPLKESDPVSLALAKLDLLHINKFVVVDADHKIKGLISIETLAEVVDEVLFSQICLWKRSFRCL